MEMQKSPVFCVATLGAVDWSCSYSAILAPPARRWSLILLPGWSTVAQSPLTATSTSRVQVIPVPHHPE
ncbi:hypothetical protein CK820_G0008111 [Pan troglodytes]|uniref:Uncharacterized protein n=1 Tax=Pan troglodytes TaxID=9598 RepID=A0A2J8NVK5_PANTR|nr:hypothetical protein CK820_G0008111 [Pan troglodytes]